jgi:hypothetical protein
VFQDTLQRRRKIAQALLILRRLRARVVVADALNAGGPHEDTVDALGLRVFR